MSASVRIAEAPGAASAAGERNEPGALQALCQTRAGNPLLRDESGFTAVKRALDGAPAPGAAHDSGGGAPYPLPDGARPIQWEAA